MVDMLVIVALGRLDDLERLLQGLFQRRSHFQLGVRAVRLLKEHQFDVFAEELVLLNLILHIIILLLEFFVLLDLGLQGDLDILLQLLDDLLLGLQVLLPTLLLLLQFEFQGRYLKILLRNLFHSLLLFLELFRFYGAQLGLKVQQLRVLNAILLMALVLLDPLVELVDLLDLSQDPLRFLLHFWHQIGCLRILAAALGIRHDRRSPFVLTVHAEAGAGSNLDAWGLVRRNVTSVVVC